MLARGLQALVVAGILLGAWALNRQQNMRDAKIDSHETQLNELRKKRINVTWQHQTSGGGIIDVEYPIPPRGDMTIEAWKAKIREESEALLELYPANVTQ